VPGLHLVEANGLEAAPARGGLLAPLREELQRVRQRRPGRGSVGWIGGVALELARPELGGAAVVALRGALDARPFS
jgi:hypothetical protein